MMGWGWMPFGGLFPLALLIIVVAGVVLLARSGGLASGLDRPRGRRSLGLDALDERYARGEIERDEYLQKRNDIEGGGVTPPKA